MNSGIASAPWFPLPAPHCSHNKPPPRLSQGTDPALRSPHKCELSDESSTHCRSRGGLGCLPSLLHQICKEPHPTTNNKHCPHSLCALHLGLAAEPQNRSLKGKGWGPQTVLLGGPRTGKICPGKGCAAGCIWKSPQSVRLRDQQLQSDEAGMWLGGQSARARAFKFIHTAEEKQKGWSNRSDSGQGISLSTSGCDPGNQKTKGVVEGA